MKKNFIITASLALFAVVPTFANTNNEVTNLPSYSVTVDRYTAAEKAIEASLAELRASAKVTPAISAQPALPQHEVASQAPAKLAPVAAHSTTSLIAVKA